MLVFVLGLQLTSCFLFLVFGLRLAFSVLFWIFGLRPVSLGLSCAFNLYLRACPGFPTRTRNLSCVSDLHSEPVLDLLPILGACPESPTYTPECVRGLQPSTCNMELALSLLSQSSTIYTSETSFPCKCSKQCVSTKSPHLIR